MRILKETSGPVTTITINRPGVRNAVDRDTEAFNGVIAAMRLPKGTKKEREARDRAMQQGYKEAAGVPLQTLRDCVAALEEARFAVEHGFASSITDAGVGALVAFAGAEGAAMNVLVNLADITDEEYVRRTRDEVEGLRRQAREHVEAATARVFGELSG